MRRCSCVVCVFSLLCTLLIGCAEDIPDPLTKEDVAAALEGGSENNSMVAQIWSTPINISSTSGHSQGADIAMDNLGNIHVVWADNTTEKGEEEIFYSRSNGTGWSKPVNISNETQGRTPAIAIDHIGNPHVVWRGAIWGDRAEDIFYSRWDGISWSKPFNISKTGKGSSRPAVAIDSLGNLYVVWSDASPGSYDIFYRRWNRTNWSNSINISNNAGTSLEPKMVTDNSGNIHVVWEDTTPGNSEIFYSHWNGTGWSNPVSVFNPTGDSHYPAIAIDPLGSIHVVWHDNTLGGNWNIFYSRSNGAVWSKPINISNNPRGSTGAAIAIDPLKNIHVFWGGYNSGVRSEIFYSHSNGTGWSNPVNISNNHGDSGGPRIAVDALGNIHLVWADDTLGKGEIFYSYGKKRS